MELKPSRSVAGVGEEGVNLWIFPPECLLIVNMCVGPLFS